MKTLKVTKMEYDEFLYPAIAANNDPNTQELRVTCRVLDILEKAGIPPKLDPATGLPVKGTHPWFQLATAEAEFDLEDAYAAHVIKRLEAQVPSLQAWRARQMLGIIDQLKVKEV